MTKTGTDFIVEWQQGIDYEYACRRCLQSWLERHRLDDKGPKDCPVCLSEDIYRCVGSSTFFLKGGGVGWSDLGYYKFNAYDKLKSQGNKVEFFDTEDDCEREVQGEKALREKKKLKRRDELERKHGLK